MRKSNGKTDKKMHVRKRQVKAALTLVQIVTLEVAQTQPMFC